MRVEVEVSLPPRALSSNGAHGHWAVVSTARKGYRQEAFFAAREAMARVQVPGVDRPMRVSILAGIKGGRRLGLYQPRDAGNLLSAIKPVWDGIVDAGLLRDDSAKWAKFGSVEITSKDGPWVRVTIEDIEEAA